MEEVKEGGGGGQRRDREGEREQSCRRAGGVSDKAGRREASLVTERYGKKGKREERRSVEVMKGKGWNYTNAKEGKRRREMMNVCRGEGAAAPRCAAAASKTTAQAAVISIPAQHLILVFKLCFWTNVPLLIPVAGATVPAGKPSYLLQEIPRPSSTRWEI